jgi:hypothetical protein
MIVNRQNHRYPNGREKNHLTEISLRAGKLNLVFKYHTIEVGINQDRQLITVTGSEADSLLPLPEVLCLFFFRLWRPFASEKSGSATFLK